MSGIQLNQFKFCKLGAYELMRTTARLRSALAEQNTDAGVVRRNLAVIVKVELFKEVVRLFVVVRVPTCRLVGW